MDENQLHGVTYEDLAFVLAVLIETGRTTHGEVVDLARKSQSLRAMIRMQATVPVAVLEPLPEAPETNVIEPKPSRKPTSKPSKRRVPKPSAKLIAARKRQGQYVGMLRHIKNQKQRERIQRIAQTKGVPAALKVLKRLAG